MNTAIAETVAGRQSRSLLDANFLKRWPKHFIDAANNPTASVAKTLDDLSELGRLRYELFIERDRKKYDHADHSLRCFIEPVDNVSLNFICRLQERISVTVRGTWVDDASCDNNLEQIIDNCELKASELKYTIINSRFAVAPTIEARRHIVPLFNSMFRCARIVKANFCVASTRHELIPLFKRFGFKESKSKNQYYSNKAGWMSVLMLDINDRNYLQKTQSPFLTVFDETNDNQSEGFISHG